MKFNEKSKRMRERLELTLPVRVHYREREDYEWVEMTRLIDVTPFGARLSLAHPTEPGRLLHLTMPMPRQLRCFDFVEPQYRIWALVRNLSMLPPSDNKNARFAVGVAFIGKRPPPSYELDPTKRYEVAGSVTESGLWLLREMTERAAVHTPTDDPRPETRFNLPVEVVIEVYDEKGEINTRETTVTENISRRGAAVFTTLDVELGRLVRMTSSQYQLTVVAAVRARRPGPDGIMRLHLEFIDRQWPLEGID
ncbi:MAG: PilZ domain-containing protein [Pyrinomonadaceae bacterium]|nr:PilZ domain-containing protein [Pyrinomonadaceae bacterium]